ncbi:sigma-70 family RNA polymerase sigma factor [Mongoliitalea daihaiensis]|nr:sigma-70 family RNA polymerase sigma factor [Mongoliitalea daihaiensis]UJP66094.1 sigma-70 family RNA polymerase sigma factor [Mongoliitalea daihaiensis]
MKSFFETHIWPLKSKLYRMAYLWVKDREVANDVLQQVFEKAWVKKNDLESMDNPTAWMVKTLKNESMQHFRSTRKIDSLGDLDLEDPAKTDEDERTDRIQMVLRFMDKLPNKQREVFQLREVEGLTYEEIGSYLDISLEQVKVNLFRARQQLKVYLMGKK